MNLDFLHNKYIFLIHKIKNMQKLYSQKIYKPNKELKLFYNIYSNLNQCTTGVYIITECY